MSVLQVLINQYVLPLKIWENMFEETPFPLLHYLALPEPLLHDIM